MFGDCCSAQMGQDPVPCKETVWGLPAALSETLRLAFRVCLALGLKVALIVQFAPAATLDPQVLVCEKSPVFDPVKEVLVIDNVAVPVLVSVTVLGLLFLPTRMVPKFKEVGERLTAGVPDVPVPVRPTVCGLLPALSVTETEAARVSVAVGLNVTLIVQLAPAATLDPQVLVSEKSALLVPVIEMLVTLKLAVPAFVRVTF